MNSPFLQRGTELYLPVLLLSLVITVVAYGALPILFACFRKEFITRGKYRLICFGINAVIMIVFMVLSQNFSNAAPYSMWTFVFSAIGIKILDKRGCLSF